MDESGSSHTVDEYRVSRRRVVALSLVLCLSVSLLVRNGYAGVNGANDIFVDSGQTLGDSHTRGAALGDLDGDGDLDAFAVNYGTGDRVWWNDGNAVFTDSGQSLGSESSSAVALGDVDDDGDLDAFVTAPTSKLWVNQGGTQGGTEGVFADSGQNLGSALSNDVALGDLDGDEDLDAFVANYNGSNRVWVNNGAGIFTDSGQNLNWLNSYSVDLGDVDGDGDLDAVVANFTQVDRLLVNQGGIQGGTEGVFVSSLQNLDSQNSYAVALGDVDGDSDLDIFFANYDQANTVWVNDGSGAFTDSMQLLGSLGSRDVTLADVDSDSDLDAVVANYGDPDQVWANDGLGSFSQVQGMDNAYSYEMAIADLDENGSLDIFVANQLANRVWLGANLWNVVDPPPNSHTAAADTPLSATTDGVYQPTTVTTDTFVVHSQYLGRVAGYFSSQTRRASVQGPDISTAWFYPDETFFPGELVETTLTDGITDLDGISFANYVWQFRIAAMGGSGVLSDTLQRLGNALSYEVALGDFDEDGDLDAFVVNGTAQPEQVWVNNGGNQGGSTGVFSAGVSLGDTASKGVVVGDLDADGHPDALVTKDGANIIYRNIGFGVFGQLTTVGDADSRAAALGDLDGDGDLDAFIANYEANYVWLNSGSGHFSPFPQALGVSNSSDVALGDVDKDGDLDAIVANFGVNNLWLNDGTGNFSGQSLEIAGLTSAGVALGDLDRDGDLDAFFANYADVNEVWLNDGTGTFTVTQQLGYAASYAVALGDLDDDGDLDAVVANYGQPNAVWLNDGTGEFSDSGQALGAAFSQDVALGDLDGDGDLDAFLANLSEANIVWENTDPVDNSCRIFLPLSVR